MNGYDFENFEYAECTYCYFDGYFIDESQEFDDEVYFAFREEFCETPEVQVFPEGMMQRKERKLTSIIEENDSDN